MDPERWRRLERLFERAADLATEERESLLDAECRDDPTLRREIEAVLEADGGAEGVAGRLRGAVSAMEAQAAAFDPGGADRPVAVPAAGAGDRIGAYAVERELGRGGMGRVYLARRADRAYQARVAIKVLPRGFADREHVDRFLQERQILASLNHPNIARLLDAGTTHDGLPYLVMEHVEGERLDAFCDARKLSVRDRLKLFLDVCSAVQRAHQSLIIHRDLKPANVLVNERGTPKLLDFGIAKLLAGSAVPGDPRATRTALLPMTPAYAAPEQIRGGPITTSTDVYALGAILFELLTGRLPHGAPAGPDGGDEPLALRMLRDEAPRPSRSVTGEAAVRRGTNAQALRRRLRGDLDTIVLKALARDRDRRYETVGSLADDLTQHLDGHPVNARAPTLGYRMAKLVRRNPLSSSLAAGLLLALLVFAGSMTLLAERLAEERDRALREQRESDQVSELLVDLFTVSDPAESRGEEVTAREVLDQGAERLRTELREQPELRATLLDTVGRVYRNLGLYDDAAPLLDEALALRRRVLGPEHPETLASLAHLARVTHQSGDFERAEALYREALQLQTRALGPNALPLARTFDGLARVARLQGRYDEAESFLSRGFAILRRHPGTRPERISDTLELRGAVRSDLQRFGAAEADLREALEIDRRALGPEHPAVLRLQVSLANTLRYQDELAEAEALFRRTLEAQRRVLGDDHPEVPYALNGVGLCLKDRGRLEEAEPYLREALELRKRRLGESHPAVAVSLSNLSDLLLDLGALEDAELHARQALELAREHFSGAQRAYPLVGLAEVLLARGEPEEAEALAREAVTLRREALDPDAPLLARTESLLGDCLKELGRYEEAEKLLVSARDVLEAAPTATEEHRATNRRRLEALDEALRTESR